MSADDQITTAWSDLELDQRHIDELVGSAIDPEVAKARGYRTITRPAELRALDFPSGQQKLAPGLLLPSHGVGGEIAGYQFKPNRPLADRDGRVRKYENRKNYPMPPDIPPTVRAKVLDRSAPLLVTEGIKKGDSAATKGLAIVVLPGVWNWMTPESMATFDALPLAGRPVLLAWDSDWTRNDSVAMALERFAAVLRVRYEAIPARLRLPEPAPGKKVGLDDWYAGGAAGPFRADAR